MGAASSLPLVGRVARAEAIAERESGGDCRALQQNFSHPAARFARVYPPHRGGMAVAPLRHISASELKLIPAHFSRTHTAPRPVHPRALREASLSGTGSRWPRTGATRTPNARRLKLHRPGATDGVTGLFGGSAVTPCQTARRCPGPKRWIESQPPGAMRRKASNTARGTLERRRTCGFYTSNAGLGRDRRSASVRRRIEARGSVFPERIVRMTRA